MQELKNILTALLGAFINLVSKAGSRKFIVAVVATHAMYIGLLTPELWTTIVMMWMGVQGGQDALARYKGIDPRPKVKRNKWKDDDESEDSPANSIKGVAL
jgi:hypothetical protein